MQYGSIIQNGARGFSRNAVVLIGFSILYAIVLGVLVWAGSSLNLRLEDSDNAHWGALLAYVLCLTTLISRAAR